ncbi:MAG: DUF1902 domain-containing protein [Alphaproteobacteria bacterium]|nr:MAG: DUF1902 domain-containing protein [Alphaproteobacteria bacterium]
MVSNYIIKIVKDDEAGVYTATCDEVRGLVVEEETIEAVMQSVSDLLPLLVADNLQHDIDQGRTPLFQLAKFSESRAH